MNTLKTQNRGSSAEALQHHYCDIGNDFYHLWLDPTLTYSCALWEKDEASDDLETAQMRKVDFHIAQAKAKGAERVLDVGCGWGSVLRRLVDVHGVERAVGITMSEVHSKWIWGLNHPKLEVHLEHWMDHSPVALYDGIISLEAFEHFARLELSYEEKLGVYRQFFSRCHSWLKAGGWMSLQVISYGNMRREDASEFIFTEVLPESDLPSIADIAKATERIFEIVELRNDRKDYVRTCKIWLSKLKANRAAAVKLVGEEVVKRYEKYLNFSIICFHVGTTDLLRIALRRIDNPRQ